MTDIIFDESTFNDYWQSLTITDDFIFCKVFEDAELCRKMLEILLDIKIEYIEYSEQQKQLKSGIFSKGIRLDVFVQDSTRVFDVEIQVAPKTDIALRSRYYHSNMDTSLLKKGRYYTELKENYVIFLCMFDPIGKQLPFYNFITIEENHPDIFLNDKRHTILYNVPAFEKLQSSEKCAFLEYLSKGTQGSSFASTLEKRVAEIKNNDDWRADKMTYEMNILEREREARSIALAEGIERGIEQGVSRGRIQIAQNMLSRNVSIDDIVMYTGLSLEEIVALQQS